MVRSSLARAFMRGAEIVQRLCRGSARVMMRSGAAGSELDLETDAPVETWANSRLRQHKHPPAVLGAIGLPMGQAQRLGLSAPLSASYHSGRSLYTAFNPFANCTRRCSTRVLAPSKSTVSVHACIGGFPTQSIATTG